MSPPIKAVLVIVVAVALSTCAALYNRVNELVPWRSDISAIDEAKSAGKPTLLYFTAGWCGPCQQMKQNTWTDPAVAKALEGYVPVKIDVDEQEAVAMRYQIRGIPRLIVLNPDGSVQRDIVGGMDPQDFLEWLKR